MKSPIQSSIATLIACTALLMAVAILSAAPDPDLFDGRVALPPSPSSTGQSPSSAEAVNEVEANTQSAAKDDASTESRDMNQVDGVSQGEPVRAESSKAEGQPSSSSERDFSGAGQVGGGESVENVGSQSESAVGGGGSTDSSGEASEAATQTGGSGGGSASSTRSFEEFGFGSSSATDSAVEVYRSKDLNVASSSTSSSSVTPPSTEKPGGGGAGSSEPAVATGDGDYGSNLPSGL